MLAVDHPPKYKRPPRGSKGYSFEPRTRMLLAEFPTMKATVIAERIEFPHSITT
ncbi:hypothetical protein IT072_03280 [Leifsonia sp. ZF2019]|uniref:hypothetical protein n=1 Tax=Leifsonia sp. ZF2019 TaxID=2781978 RepID=UPI001CBB2A2D|nr:hypothetical protein [Leifsonia sp. ZF2019]UAJ80093.1 hypothetical protein IT072_03280 [Leifsonia sp. ZF2019]